MQIPTWQVSYQDFKFSLADAKCCAHFDRLYIQYRSIVGIPSRLRWLCAVWSGFPPTVCARCNYCRECWAECTSCVQSGQGLSAVGASYSFGGNKNRAGSNLLIKTWKWQYHTRLRRPNTVELQWLELLLDHENLFEILVVRATVVNHDARSGSK